MGQPFLPNGAGGFPEAGRPLASFPYAKFAGQPTGFPGVVSNEPPPPMTVGVMPWAAKAHQPPPHTPLGSYPRFPGAGGAGPMPNAGPGVPFHGTMPSADLSAPTAPVP